MLVWWNYSYQATALSIDEEWRLQAYANPMFVIWARVCRCTFSILIFLVKPLFGAYIYRHTNYNTEELLEKTFIQFYYFKMQRNWKYQKWIKGIILTLHQVYPYNQDTCWIYIHTYYLSYIVNMFRHLALFSTYMIRYTQ